MAEQLKNSRTTPTCTLTSASITAGTSTSFTVSSASGLPASGTFRLLFKGASSTGSDDAIAVVGAISGTTCSSVTWEEWGSQTTFTSGAELVLDLTAAGLTAYVSDQVSTHAALTTAHAAATNLLHTTGAESASGVKTFSSGIITNNLTGTDATSSLLLYTNTISFAAGAFGAFMDDSGFTVFGRIGAAGGAPLTSEGSYETNLSSGDLTLVATDYSWQLVQGHATNQVYIPTPVGVSAGIFRFTNTSGATALVVDADPLDPNLVSSISGGALSIPAGQTWQVEYNGWTNIWIRTL